jgi:hypothetical protein
MLQNGERERGGGRKSENERAKVQARGDLDGEGGRGRGLGGGFYSTGGGINAAARQVAPKRKPLTTSTG